MKKNLINEVHIEGYLYDHKLEKKLSGPNSKTPGTEFISGTISIATDEKMQNVIQIHYTYVTATTGKGNANSTFTTLNKIITDNPTVLNVGKDKAALMRCDTAIGLKEWYRELTDEKPVIIVRNEGGFAHFATQLNEDEKQRCRFKTDMLITGVKDVEANPETNSDAYVKVRGAIFDFKNALLPVEFVARSPKAMAYFQSLDVSPKTPVFTCVWGPEQNQTVVTRTITESAFGEDEVRERQTTTREFVLNGANKYPYVWDDPDYLTAAEVSQMMADRELHLASIKKSQEEYQASKGTGSSAAAVSTNTTGYDF